MLQRCLGFHPTSVSSPLAVHTALMARLMEVPNASARLATDPAALWDLACAFNQDCSGFDAEGLNVFEKLLRLTLTHLITTKDQDRSRNYLQTFHARLINSLTEVRSTPDKRGAQRFVKASLSMFWLHRESLPKPLKEKEIMRLRRIYLGCLISDLMNIGESQTGHVHKPSIISMLATLDSMLEYEDLLRSDERRPASESNFVIAPSADLLTCQSILPCSPS